MNHTRTKAKNIEPVGSAARPVPYDDPPPDAAGQDTTADQNGHDGTADQNGHDTTADQNGHDGTVDQHGPDTTGRKPAGATGRKADVDADAGRAGARSRLVRRLRAIAGRITTALAFLLVLAALIAPDQITHLTPAAFLRIPVEGLVGVALVLVVPGRARRPVAALAGLALGLLTILKIIDMGFLAVLARPFDAVYDWSLLRSAAEYLDASIGRAGAIGSVVGAAVLAIAVPVLMTLSVLRLARIAAERRTDSTRTAMALGAAWVVSAVLGTHLVPGEPIASHSAARLAYDHALAVNTALRDKAAFASEIANDPFRDAPGRDLLTGLRGKDVIISFVESYGRDAVEDPEFASQVGAVLAAGDQRLHAAGFAARSGFLTSPTTGGGSWLAHATLLSGVWVNSQQRDSSLLASDRLTLNRAFRNAGWRAVGVMPGTMRDWPEGVYFGNDQIYDAADLGYRGKRFSFASIPDQYTLSTFQRTERAPKDRAPVMAEIALVSSHSPWTPVPRPMDWNDVGDGSVFDPEVNKAADPPDIESQGAITKLRTHYRLAIEYSLNTLISYLETYGDDDLVLVFLGDHQPAPAVTGENASRDVPITIVARDPAVLDRISDWGWQDGLRPGPQAPVWPMSAFRDKFLAAFSR